MEAVTGALCRGQSLWGPASLLPPLDLGVGLWPVAGKERTELEPWASALLGRWRATGNNSGGGNASNY